MISVSDSLGCSDHTIVKFEILMSTLKVSTKTKVGTEIQVVGTEIQVMQT